MNTVMNFRVSWNTGIYWPAEELSVFQEELCSMELVILGRWVAPFCNNILYVHSGLKSRGNSMVPQIVVIHLPDYSDVSVELQRGDGSGSEGGVMTVNVAPLHAPNRDLNSRVIRST
jgi:hypothetical protein